MTIHARVLVAMLSGLAFAALPGGIAGAQTTTASPDPMQSIYADTLTVRNLATNDLSTLNFQPNHALVVSVNRGGRVILIGGLWMLGTDNSSVCLGPSPIGGVAIPVTTSCLPLLGHISGDQWT